MREVAGGRDEIRRREALQTLAMIGELTLHRYAVAGTYVRYSEKNRNPLKDLRQRLFAGLASAHRLPDNFLLWGPPGSGKSYLVQQIAASLPGEPRLVEANLAQLDEVEFRSRLAEMAANPGPMIGFVDEVDAKLDEGWPCEALLPILEPSSGKTQPRCFVLAGSGGGTLDAFERRLRGRPKGSDLLSRIPRTNWVEVRPLDIGDRLLVAAAQFSLAAAEEGKPLHEIEKLALLYIALESRLNSARELRHLAVATIARLPVGEDRIRYDYLFRPGDPDNKQFWVEVGPEREDLTDSFVSLLGEPSAPGSRPTPPPSPMSAHAPETGSIGLAVLPFQNISADPADAYLADGLAEELIGRLSTIPGLRVIARASVQQFRAQPRPVREVADSLRVSSVLEGSVRKGGNQLRISTRLVDARADTTLWSATFDRELTDIFRTQTEIAEEVASALQLTLPARGSPRSVPTSNMEAYRLYLIGRSLWDRRTVGAVRAARTHFEQAIRLDPRYARAYSGLADAYEILFDLRGATREESIGPAMAAARKALELDGELSEAHASYGLVLADERRWPEAMREYRRALELDPAYTNAHHWHFMGLRILGWDELADGEARRWREADPASPRLWEHLGILAWGQGRVDDALAAWQVASDQGFRKMTLRTYQIAALAGAGRADVARTLYRLPKDEDPGKAGYSYDALTHSALGMADEAQHDLEILVKGGTAGVVPPIDLAYAYGALGEADQFFKWMGKALESSTGELYWITVLPIFAQVRRDARFRDIRRSFGIDQDPPG